MTKKIAKDVKHTGYLHLWQSIISLLAIR